MSLTVGEEAVWSLLSSRNRDQQHSIIAKFLQRELDASRAEVTLLHQHGHQQTELLRQQQSQSATAASTRERRRDTLKLEVSEYWGVEEDSLLRWFLEVEDAIKARHIDEEEMQVACQVEFVRACQNLGPESSITRSKRVWIVGGL